MIAQTIGRVGSSWMLAGLSHEPRHTRDARAWEGDAMNPQSGAMLAEHVTSERIKPATLDA